MLVVQTECRSVRIKDCWNNVFRSQVDLIRLDIDVVGGHLSFSRNGGNHVGAIPVLNPIWMQHPRMFISTKYK